MKEGLQRVETNNVRERIKAFDTERSGLVSRINRLERESPSRERAAEIRALEIQIMYVNQDQEGWMLHQVDEELSALKNSGENEEKRMNSLKEKESLEQSRHERAERMGARI